MLSLSNKWLKPAPIALTATLGATLAWAPGASASSLPYANTPVTLQTAAEGATPLCLQAAPGAFRGDGSVAVNGESIVNEACNTAGGLGTSFTYDSTSGEILVNQSSLGYGPKASQCLDTYYGHVNPGVPVVGGTCTGSATQQWQVTGATNGSYQLRNVGAGLCLQLPGTAVVTAAVLQTCTATTQETSGQLWSLDTGQGPSGGPTYGSLGCSGQTMVPTDSDTLVPGSFSFAVTSPGLEGTYAAVPESAYVDGPSAPDYVGTSWSSAIVQPGQQFAGALGSSFSYAAVAGTRPTIVATLSNLTAGAAFHDQFTYANPFGSCVTNQGYQSVSANYGNNSSGHGD